MQRSSNGDINTEQLTQSLPQMWFKLTLRPEKKNTSSSSNNSSTSTASTSAPPTGVVHDVVASIMIHIDRVENRITPILLESILNTQSRLSSEITMILEALAKHMKERKSKRKKRREKINIMLQERNSNDHTTNALTNKDLGKSN